MNDKGNFVVEDDLMGSLDMKRFERTSCFN